MTVVRVAKIAQAKLIKVKPMTRLASKDSSQWQRTYEINENLNVTLQRRIGEGF